MRVNSSASAWPKESTAFLLCVGDSISTNFWASDTISWSRGSMRASSSRTPDDFPDVDMVSHSLSEGGGRIRYNFGLESNCNERNTQLDCHRRGCPHGGFHFRSNDAGYPADHADHSPPLPFPAAGPHY